MILDHSWTPRSIRSAPDAQPDLFDINPRVAAMDLDEEPIASRESDAVDGMHKRVFQSARNRKGEGGIRAKFRSTLEPSNKKRGRPSKFFLKISRKFTTI